MNSRILSKYQRPRFYSCLHSFSRNGWTAVRRAQHGTIGMGGTRLVSVGFTRQAIEAQTLCHALKDDPTGTSLITMPTAVKQTWEKRNPVTDVWTNDFKASLLHIP